MTPTFDGLYALASLDGAPLSARDAAVLGLPAAPPENGFAIAACDRGRRIATATDHGFLGHLDEPAALADALGLDPATPPAALVRVAAERYGDDAPIRALGEWAFARWDDRTRTLTLMLSDTAREPLLFTTDGRRVAVAPHIRVLRGLDSLDATPYDRGLLLSMGRAAIRSAWGDETLLRGVYMVFPGTRVTIDRDRVTTGLRGALPVPPRWQGDFADAMAALDALLRRILRQHLARHPTAAVMLSGGLDSSLIAAFAAAERAPGTTLVAVTSAAPPGSGLSDELEFSRAVAERAGIAIIPVVPPDDADAYAPAPDALHILQQPVGSQRHYVYDALYRVAAECGADAILDGSDGEWTLTGYPDAEGSRQWFRDTARRAAAWAARPTGGDGVQNAFHVRLSRDAIALAQTELRDALCMRPPVKTVRHRDDVCGYAPGFAKSRRFVMGMRYGGIRHLVPFRDRRLLTLFAGMPYRFLTEGGLTRAPARALLAGKVPDHVRLRTQGRPFSPDYFDRLRRQALPARDRLPDYARMGVGEWLDLAWLDSVLMRVGSGARVPVDAMVEAQATACAAAFLADWLAGG